MAQIKDKCFLIVLAGRSSNQIKIKLNIFFSAQQSQIDQKYNHNVNVKTLIVLGFDEKLKKQKEFMYKCDKSGSQTNKKISEQDNKPLPRTLSANDSSIFSYKQQYKANSEQNDFRVLKLFSQIKRTCEAIVQLSRNIKQCLLGLNS